MKLVELLNTTYEWSGLHSDGGGDYSGSFETESGDKIKIYFNSLLRRGEHTLYEVEFNRNGDYGTTGEGDAAKIFATVLEALQELVSSVDPDFITFSSKKAEASRTKFYRRLIKRMEKMGFKDMSDSLDDLPEDPQRIVRNYIRDFKDSQRFVLAKV